MDATELSVSERAHAIIEACERQESANPLEVFWAIEALPFVRMHGPEHHVLDGAAFLTAFHNAGGAIDLPAALDALVARGLAMPGAICGLWGVCGSAASVGAALAIIEGTAHSAGRKPHRRPALLQAQCLRGPSAGGILRASAVRRRDGERHDRLPRLCPQRAMLGREVSFPPFGERASDASVGAEPARSAVFRPTLRKMPEEMRGHCGWSRCPVLRAVSAGLVGRGWRTLRNMVAI